MLSLSTPHIGTTCRLLTLPLPVVFPPDRLPATRIAGEIAQARETEF